MHVAGAAAGNEIEGNFIGVDSSGLAPLGNMYDGVFLDAPQNRVVGRNVISSNGQAGAANGVTVGGTGNLIANNYVGVGVDGSTKLPNTLNGIGVVGSSNVVGGDQPGDRNVMSPSIPSPASPSGSPARERRQGQLCRHGLVGQHPPRQ